MKLTIKYELNIIHLQEKIVISISSINNICHLKHFKNSLKILVLDEIVLFVTRILEYSKSKFEKFPKRKFSQNNISWKIKKGKNNHFKFSRVSIFANYKISQNPQINLIVNRHRIYFKKRILNKDK